MLVPSLLRWILFGYSLCCSFFFALRTGLLQHMSSEPCGHATRESTKRQHQTEKQEMLPQTVIIPAAASPPPPRTLLSIADTCDLREGVLLINELHAKQQRPDANTNTWFAVHQFKPPCSLKGI